MTKLSAAVFFLTLALAPMCPAGELSFSPVVHSFTPSDYDAGRQNWDVSRSSDGLVYFANNRCLLEFDNHVWRQFRMPGRGPVRSVFCNPDGRIYCGSFEEFGYFEKVAGTIDLEYVSLSAKIQPALIAQSEIWNIVSDPVSGKVVFQSFGGLFVYDGTSVEKIQTGPPLNVLSAAGYIFAQIMDGDLLVMRGDGFIPLLEKTHSVVSALPFADGAVLFLGTGGEGTVVPADVLSGKGDRSGIHNWNYDIRTDLSTETVNKAVMTKDSCYVIGTISGGIHCIDMQGHSVWNADVSGQLRNNTILGLFCDEDNNVWAALDDGVAMLANSEGVSIASAGFNAGTLYDVCVDDNGATWLATNQGAYFGSRGSWNRVDGMTEQTWFVSPFDGGICFGYNRGLRKISGSSLVPVCEGADGGAFCMCRFEKGGVSWMVVGAYDSPHLYMDDDGVWRRTAVLDSIRHQCRNIEYDGRNTLWCEDFKGGLLQIKLSNDMNSVFSSRVYDTLGEVSDSVFNVLPLNGRMVFTNGREFYTYVDIADAVLPYSKMNESLGFLSSAHESVYIGGNLWWLVSDRFAAAVEFGDSGFRVVRMLPFSFFGVKVEELSHISHDAASGMSFLCLGNILVRIDAMKYLSRSGAASRPISLLSASGVSADGETLALATEGKVKVPYRFNSLKLTLRYPVFHEPDSWFRFRLEGLSDEWNSSSTLPDISFSRLRPGRYRLVVKDHGGADAAAMMEYQFSVMRPWYSSWGMILLYMLLVCSAVVVVHRLTFKRMKRQQEKAFMQRQNESLEEALKEKSKDLASVTMTRIAHNEVLKSLSSEIAAQKEEGHYSARNLDKLQRIINGSIVSDEEKWDTFQANFDMIHENFFRNLKEKYPSLTATDIRMCALLRINLSTKDIANMLNLTVRGVESARYRLRRKFDIPAEESLTDFLIRFK